MYSLLLNNFLSLTINLKKSRSASIACAMLLLDELSRICAYKGDTRRTRRTTVDLEGKQGLNTT